MICSLITTVIKIPNNVVETRGPGRSDGVGSTGQHGLGGGRGPTRLHGFQYIDSLYPKNMFETFC